MSGVVFPTSRERVAHGRPPPAEASLPHPDHQAAQANRPAPTEQRTTRRDGPALTSSARTALFLALSSPSDASCRDIPGWLPRRKCVGSAAVNWRRPHVIRDG
jgi:hypothetical protein